MVLVSRGTEPIRESGFSFCYSRTFQRAGYVLLLDRVVILACPTHCALLHCKFQIIYKQTVTHERPRNKTNPSAFIISGTSERILIKFST